MNDEQKAQLAKWVGDTGMMATCIGTIALLWGMLGRKRHPTMYPTGRGRLTPPWNRCCTAGCEERVRPIRVPVRETLDPRAGGSTNVGEEAPNENVPAIAYVGDRGVQGGHLRAERDRMGHRDAPGRFGGNVIKPGLYKHYKGNLYRVLFVAEWVEELGRRLELTCDAALVVGMREVYDEDVELTVGTCSLDTPLLLAKWSGNDNVVAKGEPVVIYVSLSGEGRVSARTVKEFEEKGRLGTMDLPRFERIGD